MSDNTNIEQSQITKTTDTGCEKNPDLISRVNEVSVSKDSNAVIESSRNHTANLPPLPLGGEQEPKPKKKRGAAVRGVIVIGRSLSNTVDDHFFRGLRPSSAANKVFIQRFLMPTINDTMAILEPNELIEKHRRIDEHQLPFRELMLQVEGTTLEKIDANQDILLSCLGLATFSVLYSLYKLFYFCLSILVSDLPTTFAQWVTVGLWTSFFMFSISVYISFAYHNWVIERDRFGTGGMFLKDFLNGKREAIFPYKFARKYL